MLKFALKTGLAAGLASAAAVLPARADQQACGVWKAALEQREEGKALTASVCESGKPRDSVIEVLCYNKQVNIRYLAVMDGDAEPKHQKQSLVFKAGRTQHRVPTIYEGLDGAFAAYLPMNHRLLGTLMSGERLTIAATRDKLPAVSFSLKGSRKAISRVLSQC